MRPDKPKTQKGLTPTKRVRPYQVSSRQGAAVAKGGDTISRSRFPAARVMAGFTLLTFLLTQLAWPVPAFALRVQAGLESASESDLKAALFEGASAGLEGREDKETKQPMPGESTGAFVRRLREAAGFSGEELAKRIRIHPGSVSRIELHNQPVSYLTAVRLEQALGADRLALMDSALDPSERLSREGNRPLERPRVREKLGAFVKRLRLNANLRVEELGGKIGIHMGNVSRIENDRQGVDYRTAVRLERVLGADRIALMDFSLPVRAGMEEPPELAISVHRDPKLIGNLRVELASIVFRAVQGKEPVNVQGLLSLAKQINPEFQYTPSGVAELIDLNSFRQLLTKLNQEVLLPADEFTLTMSPTGSPEMIDGRILRRTWKSYPYLGRPALIWMAEAKFSKQVRGISWGRFGFVDPDVMQAQDRKVYRYQMRSPRIHRKLEQTLRTLLRRSHVGLSTYRSFFGRQATWEEELRHSQDFVFTLLRNNQDPVRGDAQRSEKVEAILKPSSPLRATRWVTQKEKGHLLELAGKLGSLIAHIDGFIQQRKYNLAYARFVEFFSYMESLFFAHILGFNLELILLGSHYFSPLLWREILEGAGYPGSESMDELISESHGAIESPEERVVRSMEVIRKTKDRAIRAREFLRQLYETHFYSDEERFHLLSPAGLESAPTGTSIQSYLDRPDVRKSLTETGGILRFTDAQMVELGVPPGVRGGVILRLDGTEPGQLSGLLFAQPRVREDVPAGLRDLPWVELADDSVQAGLELKNAHAEFGKDLALFEAREGLTPEAIQAGLEANRYENHPRIVLIHSEQVGGLTRHLLVYFATAKREAVPPVIIPILMDVIQDSYGNFYAVAFWA